MHPYPYAYSTPLRYTDPSGRCLGWLWGAPDCEATSDPNRWDWEGAKGWFGAGADLAPIVGDAKGFVEVFVGCDLVTGEYLGYWRFAGLVPILGPRLKQLKIVRKVDIPVEEFRKLLGYTDDLPPRGPDLPPGPPRGPGDGPPGDGPPPGPKDNPPTPPICNPNSFSADTLVSTADGLRPISGIAVGDLVLAWDEATRTTGLFTVTAVMAHRDPAQVHLTLGGEFIETTPEHPFFTQERGWVDAGDLWRGAHVRQADGSFDPIWSIAVETEPQVMYNLTVAQAHTFFVGVQRWLVHNVSCEISWLHRASLTPEENDALNAAMEHIRNGIRPPNVGHWGGKGDVYRNEDKYLPENIEYLIYDVPARTGDTTRGTRRVIIGDDGSWYYTNTHYGDQGGNPFYRLK